MKTSKTDYAQLFVWTDIDPAYEDDFNQWYNCEHMEERVAIEGFQWARRYRNISDTERRYLAIYRTENIGVFGSASYAQAFQHQTDWSNTNFARMSNTIRRVMHIPAEGGFGSGAAAAMVTLDQSGVTSEDLQSIAQSLSNSASEGNGILAYHVMTPDEALSTPLPSENPVGRTLETAVLIDATDQATAEKAGKTLLQKFNLSDDRVSLFSFIWELRSEDMEKVAARNAAQPQLGE